MRRRYKISNNTEISGNRIGLLFDLIARRDDLTSSGDPYATFYYFNQQFNANEAVEKDWLNVKRAFMQLEEWYKDRWIYHLVGFLIWSGIRINALRQMAEQRTKKQFKEALRAAVLERTFQSAILGALSVDTLRKKIADIVANLTYGPDSKKIKPILLLFNLITMLQSKDSNLRFHFECFKKERWDIEHVRSIADAKPASRDEQNDWLQHCSVYLKAGDEAPELSFEIDTFLNLPKSVTANFDQLYEKVLNHFKVIADEERDHNICNLVLLDAGTNRSYKNAVFAIKRQRVLDLDKAGVFVPLCTRNVFLKCYSGRVGQAICWTQTDSESYQAEVIQVLVQFFEGGWIDA